MVLGTVCVSPETRKQLRIRVNLRCLNLTLPDLDPLTDHQHVDQADAMEGRGTGEGQDLL